MSHGHGNAHGCICGLPGGPCRNCRHRGALLLMSTRFLRLMLDMSPLCSLSRFDFISQDVLACADVVRDTSPCRPSLRHILVVPCAAGAAAQAAGADHAERQPVLPEAELQPVGTPEVRLLASLLIACYLSFAACGNTRWEFCLRLGGPTSCMISAIRYPEQ